MIYIFLGKPMNFVWIMDYGLDPNFPHQFYSIFMNFVVCSCTQWMFYSFFNIVGDTFENSMYAGRMTRRKSFKVAGSKHVGHTFR